MINLKVKGYKAIDNSDNFDKETPYSAKIKGKAYPKKPIGSPWIK